MVSIDKTKSMLSAVLQRKVAYAIGGVSIEQVNSFKYLGSTITYDNDCGKDVRVRCAQSLSAMSDVQTIWNDSNLELASKNV